MNEILNNEPAVEASYLMRNDYMNEYTHLFHLLLNAGQNGQVIVNQEFHVPRGFTERYEGRLEILATGVVVQNIKILDELATEVNKLIKEVPLSRTALLGVIKQVAAVCDKHDWVADLERVFEK